MCCFISCKTKTDYSNVDLSTVSELLSDNAAYHITGDKNFFKIKGNLFPDKLKDFLTAQLITEDGIYTVFELINPDYIGVLDSTGFYTGCDDGQWVDDLVYRINEMLTGMTLDDLEKNPLPPVNEESTAEEIERALEDSKKIEKCIIDSSNYLRILEFDNEVFIPAKDMDSRIFIEKNESNVTRSFYDELYRIVKKEYWEINNVKNSRIIRTELYEYNDDSLKPVKKIDQTDIEKKYFYYDSNGQAVKNEQYVIYEGRAVLKTVSNWSYDSQKRVTEEIIRTNNYKDKSYQKIESKQTVKTKYFYNNGDEISPDFEYYVNGELKIKNVYSSEKGRYTSQIFFDDMFAVKTYYEDNLRKKEVYTVNNVIKRVETYE